ncbi:hypothetical protein ACH4Q6_05585 [Streptomyces lydicus]|uniref:hypothetical protein n=1 Tax=Streptomyces lydicus TaxID=47763 RepID=UPI0037B647BF
MSNESANTYRRIGDILRDLGITPHQSGAQEAGHPLDGTTQPPPLTYTRIGAVLHDLGMLSEETRDRVLEEWADDADDELDYGNAADALEEFGVAIAISSTSVDLHYEYEVLIRDAAAIAGDNVTITNFRLVEGEGDFTNSFDDRLDTDRFDILEFERNGEPVTIGAEHFSDHYFNPGAAADAIAMTVADDDPRSWHEIDFEGTPRSGGDTVLALATLGQATALQDRLGFAFVVYEGDGENADEDPSSFTYAQVGAVLHEIGMISEERLRRGIEEFADYAHESGTHYEAACALEHFGVAVSVHADDIDSIHEGYAYLLEAAAEVAGDRVAITDVRLVEGEGGLADGGRDDTLEFERDGKTVSILAEHTAIDYYDHLAAREAIEATGHEDDPREWCFLDFQREEHRGYDTVMVFATPEQRKTLGERLRFAFPSEAE